MGDPSVLIKIAETDVPTRDGRTILAGALTVDNEPKPITTVYDIDTKEIQPYSHKLWGKFDHVEERDGFIFAEVTPDLPAGWCITIEVSLKEYEQDVETLVIKEGKILGAALSPLESWPWDSDPLST